MELYPDRALKQLPVSRLKFSYTYLDSDKDLKNYESKFVLSYLRHQYIIHIEHNLLYNLTQIWKIRYENRLGIDAYYLVDTRIKWKHKRLEVFADLTNLFDIFYEDIGAIPMPGRWLKVGLNFNVF